jgi:GAF domain-containing protein
MTKIEELRRCLQVTVRREEQAKCAAEVIRRYRNYRWVGLYDVGHSEISVIAWDGPDAPAYPRFPTASGLNGAAVASRAPVIVQDVSKDPRYLTTLETTKAEMIMPVLRDGRVVGTIDVESDRAGAFTDEDRVFLETCTAVVLPLWSD